MNNLEKLIEQYETETNENAKLGYGRAFVEWLASRPTCGKEQRKFLDEVERLQIVEDTFGTGIYLGKSTCIYDQDLQWSKLQKVIKGE